MVNDARTAMHWQVEVTVMPKEEVNDPQGDSVERGLHALGFGEASAVRVGKVIMLTVEAHDAAVAEARAGAMCDRLLANPVIESYRIDVLGPVEHMNETVNR